nr:MAG TPA: N6 adenosine methyltransferase subunit [Caudoviricetes sp.]
MRHETKMLWGDGDERMIINDPNDIKEAYGLIYADPPWKQSKGGKKSVRENSSGKPLDYPTCSLDEIKEHLRLATESTTENSILFLWTIDKYLFEAQQIAESLGYKLHARMIWDKVTGIPAAFTVRYGHEYLLYMYKGKLTPVAKDERGKIHTVFRERVTKHSKKPDIAYEIIERLYPDLKKLEMYARETRDGWDSFGNEVA